MDRHKWKRAWRHRPGQGRFPSRPGRCGLLLVLVAGALAVPAAGRADDGCVGSLSASAKTVEGLPRDSGEASGLAFSSRQPGLAWMIRDSGHPASVYALRFDGDGRATSREIPVTAAQNHDWEDVTYAIAADGQPVLWVVESGQGGSNRVIYEIVEPSDPDTVTSLQPRARYAYAYPDGSANTEAAFTWDGGLVLASKNFPARLYRFGPLSPTGVNQPTFVGELADSNGISVARPSPDGRWLITATHETVMEYRSAQPGVLESFTGREPFHMVVASPGDNVEAGDFVAGGGCRLTLLSEDRNTYRLEG